MAVVALCAIPVWAGDQDADTYIDGKLTVQWTHSGDDFSGTMTLGAQHFPATAHQGASGLAGTFSSGANQFQFTGSINGDTLTLNTGNVTYVLKKQGADAANPLAAPVNPLAAPAAADGPAGYTIVNSTDAGKALTIKKDGTTSVGAALEATFPDLATYFGGKLQVGSAYQDAKDSSAGGATFSSTLNGQAVKGIVSCKVADKTATVDVVYAKADTSKADWDKLMTPPTPPAAADKDSGPQIPLTEFDFPDGSGSIGLADGWSTKMQTMAHAVLLTGPANQKLGIGLSTLVQTPDSPLVKQLQQQQAWMQQMQRNNPYMAKVKPAPPPRFLIAPYSDPLEALKALTAQLSKRSVANGGPATEIVDIISNDEIPTTLPGQDAKAAKIVYTFNQTSNGDTELYRCAAAIQMSNYGNGAWFFYATSATGPDKTFPQDYPVMTAMLKSAKPNQEKIKQIFAAENAAIQQETQQIAIQGQQQLAAQRQQFQQQQAQEQANYQAQRQAQQESFAAHNQQWAQQENLKQQQTADFIEQIRGTRTVYDVQTGQEAQVNLNDVNGVVNSLNQAALDPNRFVQVPLRDTFYNPTPVPGQ